MIVNTQISENAKPNHPKICIFCKIADINYDENFYQLLDSDFNPSNDWVCHDCAEYEDIPFWKIKGK